MKVDFNTKKLRAVYDYNSAYKHMWHIIEKEDEHFIGTIYYQEEKFAWVFVPEIVTSHQTGVGFCYVESITFENIVELSKLKKKISVIDRSQKDLRKVKEVEKVN